MSAQEAFAAAMVPVVAELLREVFKSSGGNVTKARRIIRSRTADVKRERASIDAEARRRFGR